MSETLGTPTNLLIALMNAPRVSHYDEIWRSKLPTCGGSEGAIPLDTWLRWRFGSLLSCLAAILTGLVFDSSDPNLPQLKGFIRSRYGEFYA